MPTDTWDQKLKEHQFRMGQAKSSIPKDAPFQLSFRSPRQSPRGPRAIGSLPAVIAATSGSRVSTANSSIGQGRPAPPRLPLTLDDLADSERKLCDDFIRMLQSKSSDESKELLEAIFVTSETKRLLKGYGGVYPGLLQAKRPAEADPQ
eukprot:GILJ01027551.1.p1 GENE.GILJ01027551.1~~GILJ01027551.1.p1  ORF type:complete len:149 (+),score=14.17 GILJ01027551.1:1-447(+)